MNNLLAGGIGAGAGMAGGRSGLMDALNLLDAPRRGLGSAIKEMMDFGSPAEEVPYMGYSPRDLASYVTGAMPTSEFANFTGSPMSAMLPNLVYSAAMQGIGQAKDNRISVDGELVGDPPNFTNPIPGVQMNWSGYQPKQTGSWLPMILGGVGGAASAMLPGGMPFAPLAAAGGMAIGQKINEIFRPQHAGYWNPQTGNMAGDMLLQAAFDPLTYAGGLGGMLLNHQRQAAGLAGNAMRAAASAPVRITGLGDDVARSSLMSGAPRETVQDVVARINQGMPSPAAMPALMPQPPMPSRLIDAYTPEQLAWLGLDIAPSGNAGRTMAKVGVPEGELLQALGYMKDPTSFASKGAPMTTMGLQGQLLNETLPNWLTARGTGGWTKFAPGMEPQIAHLQDLTGLTEGFGRPARLRMLERMRMQSGMSALPKPFTPQPMPENFLQNQERLREFLRTQGLEGM